MTAEREDITIALFDKLCNYYGGEILQVDHLRKSFIPSQFKICNEVEDSGILE